MGRLRIVVRVNQDLDINAGMARWRGSGGRSRERQFGRISLQVAMWQGGIGEW